MPYLYKKKKNQYNTNIFITLLTTELSLVRSLGTPVINLNVTASSHMRWNLEITCDPPLETGSPVYN